MTQTQTPSFPGFPFGPNAPEVIATMPVPSAEFDALLAMICDGEADIWFGGALRADRRDPRHRAPRRRG